MLATVAAREGMSAVTRLAAQWWEANRDSFGAVQQASDQQASGHNPTDESAAEVQS
jgi:hypothetical protein